MNNDIVFLPGDGVGPEVTVHARRVLEAISDLASLGLRCSNASIGGAGYDVTGETLPPATLAACMRARAVFLGAVGGPKWQALPLRHRPETGVLRLRRELGAFANICPIRTSPSLTGLSPLKTDVVQHVDILFVREATGGIYYGDNGITATSAFDTAFYALDEIERVVRTAANLARRRRGKIASIDKANHLATSGLWRETAARILSDEFPQLIAEHLFVDTAAMHLLRRPAEFDVVVTDGLFGDILIDEASMLVGSPGLIPSGSVGDSGPGLYEPIHGSAPHLAGRNVANPAAAILSIALLLRHTLLREDLAVLVENSVASCLSAGIRTRDVAGDNPPVSTDEFGHHVLQRLAT